MFRNLNILKCDRNPIEWPPRSVMETLGSSNTAQEMKEWIRSLQKWMEGNSYKSELVSFTARNGRPEMDNNRSVFLHTEV